MSEGTQKMSQLRSTTLMSHQKIENHRTITKTRLFNYIENLVKAVLTGTHNLYFEKKYDKYQNFFI